MNFVNRLTCKARSLGLQTYSWNSFINSDNNPKTPLLQQAEQGPNIEIMDGSIEPRPGKSGLSRKRNGGDLCAIFVHAGAGYHSVQNERVHLGACEDAARTAMTFLKNGGSAVDAIEAAIKVLEDNEITNAGYGSNLSMDGTVEGDATIVDYLGRAGAVGAIGNVINPVHVARLLLDESTKPLSLKRVPPNLLVGQGAVDYAYAHKVPILPNDALVSPAARDRWAKWSRDLHLAHNQIEPSAADLKDIAALRNEGQPYSPHPSTEKPIHARSSSRTWDRRPNGKPSPLSQSSASSNQWEEGLGSSPTNPVIIGDSNEHESFDAVPGLLPQDFEDWNNHMVDSNNLEPPNREDLDLITDTVGAIAIDCHGKMAAGSSSGGIGMKYKGRIGPAALVGVGTAVMPVNPKDKDETCVGAVTSGTGEHMATTMAASTCASRLYYNQAMSKKGVLESSFEEESIQNFIKHDFMKHPSVDSSHSVGAIGVMAVKKTVEGIWLHFAHNTDSFALASMTSDDYEPSSVMSRSKPGSTSVNCTSGGRAMHHTEVKRERMSFKRQKQSRSDPEPANIIEPPTVPVTVYSGTVHPDGNSLMLWEPMVEHPVSGRHGIDTQRQSDNAAEHNETMTG